MIQNLNRSELLLKLLYLDALCIVNLRFINNTAPCDKYSPMKSDSDPELPDMASFCSLQSTAPVVFQTFPGCPKPDHRYSPSPAAPNIISEHSPDLFIFHGLFLSRFVLVDVPSIIVYADFQCFFLY